MALPGGNLIYTADDLYTVVPSAPNANVVERSFICTPATALLQTAATGFVTNDIILLAPIPGNAVLVDWVIRVPQLDTGATMRLDVGDNVVLSGAVNITTSTTTANVTQTTAGGTFTLTASASTASFASTGFLMVNGQLIAYTAITGSTFTGCNAQLGNVNIPPGSLVQQAANTQVYSAVVVPQSAVGITLFPWGAVSSTTWTTATSKPGAIPVRYAAPFNTQPPVGQPNFSVPAQQGQRYFTMDFNAGPGTYSAPSVAITGSIRYYMTGYVV